jgi:WD40 repeat protein
MGTETSAISGTCFSPCGNYFACLTRNHKISVRDMRMMEVLVRLSHKSFLCPGAKTGISFSSDSRFLSCGSFNGNIFNWRLDGSCDGILHAGNKPVLAVEWNPNESQLASLDYSGYLSVWS